MMRQAVSDVAWEPGRLAGNAFLEQARDFFQAASRAHTAAAKPLLLYYAFLNLAKALVLTRRPGAHLEHAHHGLREKLDSGKTELVAAYLEAQPSGARPSVFDMLLTELSGSGLRAVSRLDVLGLLRQIVTGHRVLGVADRNCGERFVGLGSIHLLHDPKTSEMWTVLGISRGDLARLRLSQTELLRRTRLAVDWRVVAGLASMPSGAIWLEQDTPFKYNQGWIAEAIPRLIAAVRPVLWRTVLSTPPYHRYYLYAAPPSDQAMVLPQMASAYALLFYFGSITRYRPHHFDRILLGKFGAFVEILLNEQPSQLLFQFASEFIRRDVVKPAIV